MLRHILATPATVLVVENAALNAIRWFLEPGESAVGTTIDVCLIAATPIGDLVSGGVGVDRRCNRIQGPRGLIEGHLSFSVDSSFHVVARPMRPLR